MASKKAITWVNYMEQLSEQKIAPGQLMIEGIDKYINVHQPAFNIIHHSMPLIYLLDYTTAGTHSFRSNAMRFSVFPPKK